MITSRLCNGGDAVFVLTYLMAKDYGQSSDVIRFNMVRDMTLT
jgi:hypothetical protein